MTALHEQLVRDHISQLLRDARRANRSKLAHRPSRRCDPVPTQPA